MLGSLSSYQPAAQERSETTFRSQDDTQVVDADVPCGGGGSVRFAGELVLSTPTGLGDDFDPSNPGPLDPSEYAASVSFSFDVRFEGCRHDGVTMDGDMRYTLNSAWDADADSLSLAWDYEGEVEFSGAVEGACRFDFGGSGLGDAEDWNRSDPARFDGDACGFEAAEVASGE